MREQSFVYTLIGHTRCDECRWSTTDTGSAVYEHGRGLLLSSKKIQQLIDVVRCAVELGLRKHTQTQMPRGQSACVT